MKDRIFRELVHAAIVEACQKVEIAIDQRKKLARVPGMDPSFTVERDGSWTIHAWVRPSTAGGKADMRKRPFRISGHGQVTPDLAADDLIASLDSWAEVV